MRNISTNGIIWSVLPGPTPRSGRVKGMRNDVLASIQGNTCGYNTYWLRDPSDVPR
jgi:hypothetical protein